MIRSNCNFISVIIQAAVLSYTALLITTAQAQQDTAIVRTYGGPYYEEGKEIIECAAGGYAIIGTTGSDQLNNTNIYLLRIDGNLNCVWNRNYGGADVEWGYSLVENAQGQLLLCGYTNSQGHGGYDILVIKVDEDGNVIWQQTYGGTDWDFGYKIIAHPTDGYLICGKTYSYGNGGSDGYLLHINEDGNIINEWTYGSEGDDELRDMDIIPETQELIIFGTSEVDGLMCASTRKLDINTGGIVWEHQESDNSNNFYANAIHCNNESIFLVGVKKHETLEHSYYRQLSQNGEELSFFLESPQNSYVFNDIKFFNDHINVVGGSRVYGYGGMDCIMYRLSLSGIFEGGFFYGDTADDFFSSLIIDDEKMVLTGARQNPQTQQWQLLVMLYNREILSSEGNMDPIDNGCMTVGIEIPPVAESLKTDFPCIVYDLTGKIILQNVPFDQIKLGKNIADGLYIIYDIQNNRTLKISIN